MCGIAGVVSATRESNISEALVRAMCDPIVHRGPDDEGILVKDGSGLGMRRLSIIDLSGGHQPVFNEDRSAWIVFNGEIYNFPELRPELEKRGHRFATKTDTEVIIHLYEEMGADCVNQLRGMFAIAIYDQSRRKLILARDRLGKKPLHYALVKDKLYFASEIKSILAVAPELAEVNPQGLLEYLYYGYVPDPITAFTGIQKLPAGHLLEFENGKIHVRQYWDLPQYGTRNPKSEEECLEELEHRLLEATRIRLISDVPLGAFLSGGTDSSTVVALMARASDAPVKTFSIGFTKGDFNEAAYARMVAKKFGTEHHEMILEPNVVETVEHLTGSMEEPFGDSSMLPTYYVSQMARRHVTVALSGDGGDEIFAGYDRYRIHSRRRLFEHIPSWVRGFYRDHVFKLMPRSMAGRKFTYNVTLPWRERYVDGLSFVPAFERDLPLLSADFRDVLGRSGDEGNNDPHDLMMRYFANAPANDPVSELLYVDTKTYLPGDILTKVDRMSMLNSLETRAPMLDHKFVEWVTGLPTEWKLRGNSQKYILRKLAERVGVPREALDRPKQGFSLPLVHWMRNELKDVLMTLLEPRTLQRGYFEAAGIRKLMNDHLLHGKVMTGRIWRLLMFELWHRNFLERFTKPAGLFSLPIVAGSRSRTPISTSPMAVVPAGE
jgi:asparagine synthase (glutamine-hydrolysing)